VLADEYTPIFDVRDIINLGVREFYLKMSVNGEVSEAFSGRTMDMVFPEKDLSGEIVALSRAAYCMPRTDVEDVLTKWDEGAEDVAVLADLENAGRERQKGGLKGGAVIMEEVQFEMPLI